MVRNLIIGVIILAMLGWTFFQALDSEEDQQFISVEEDERIATLNEPDEENLEKKNEVGIQKGNIAPNFDLQTLDGETVKLTDFKGEKIMLNFWATWCPPCRAEMPDMQKVHENHDINIIAVNLTQTETNINAVETFVDDFGLTFPILLDEHIEVADQYAIQPVPTSFLIDSEGRIANIAIGPMNEDMIIQRFNEMD